MKAGRGSRVARGTNSRDTGEAGALECGRILDALRKLASASHREGLVRFAIPADRALGVPVGKIQQLAKTLKKGATPSERHALAEALWHTDCYEARLLACFVDDPDLVTRAQMDRWCRDFDNWAICDTACFHLFDRVDPGMAFGRVRRWSGLKGEFQKRAAFALIASIALHLKPKDAEQEAILGTLELIERAAGDDRNFVKKGVSWALRGVGRRTPRLRKEAIRLARRLESSDDPTARWIGKDALRDLQLS